MGLAVLTAVAALTTTTVPCEPGVGCVVKVRVARGVLRLRVDPNADLTVLTARGANRIGLMARRDAPIVPVHAASSALDAVMTQTTVRVGEFTEAGVFVAMAPDLDLGPDDGVLGQSFLERFDVSIGTELKLLPIDREDDERKGGRGERYWRIRFEAVHARLARYVRALEAKKKVDAALEAQIGKEAIDGDPNALVRRLEAFMKRYRQALETEASRRAVPRRWRRGR